MEYTFGILEDTAVLFFRTNVCLAKLLTDLQNFDNYRTWTLNAGLGIRVLDGLLTISIASVVLLPLICCTQVETGVSYIGAWSLFFTMEQAAWLYCS